MRTATMSPSFDQDNNEILDQTEMYSGCWGQAYINFFPFNSNVGNKGIAVV